MPCGDLVVAGGTVHGEDAPQDLSIWRLQLLPAATASTVAGCGSALRLRLQLQQGERVVHLCLAFHAAGHTLLQLQPAPSRTAVTLAQAWLPGVWQRLVQQLPAMQAIGGAHAAAAGGEQPSPALQLVRQAWVPLAALPETLAAVVQAVASLPAS